MPFLPTNEDEDKKKGQEQSAAPTTGGSATSGTITGAGGGTSESSSGSKPKGPSRSGSFTNLQSYITANKGNDAQMGQGVRNSVDAQANNAREGLGSFTDAAKEGVTAGTVHEDKNMQSKFTNDAGSVDKDSFNNQYHASYGGPNAASEVAGFDQANRDFSNLQSKANSATGGLYDRQNLLGDVYKRPDYSRGQRLLDSFILGGGQGGQEALQGITDTYGEAGKEFDAARQDVNSQIDTGRATTEATRNATRRAFRDAKAGLDAKFTSAADKAGAANKNRKKEFASLRTGLESGDAAALKQLGIDPKTAQFLQSQGYDLTSLVSKGGQAAAGDYVQDQDVSQYNSLMGLIGGDTKSFKKSGGGGAYSTKDDLIKAASEMAALKGQMADDNASAAAKYKAARQQEIDRGSMYQDLGLSEDELQAMRTHGIDLQDYQALSGEYGQTHKSMGRYNELADLLGIKGGSGSQNTMEINTDLQGLRNKIKERQDFAAGDAARLAKLEEESALNAKIAKAEEGSKPKPKATYGGGYNAGGTYNEGGSKGLKGWLKKQRKGA